MFGKDWSMSFAAFAVEFKRRSRMILTTVLHHPHLQEQVQQTMMTKMMQMLTNVDLYWTRHLFIILSSLLVYFLLPPPFTSLSSLHWSHTFPSYTRNFFFIPASINERCRLQVILVIVFWIWAPWKQWPQRAWCEAILRGIAHWKKEKKSLVAIDLLSPYPFTVQNFW